MHITFHYQYYKRDSHLSKDAAAASKKAQIEKLNRMQGI